jgi:uncharacterized protein YecE (DUF72 family)
LVAELCRELDLVHVVDPFQKPPATRAAIQYYRLHGPTGSRHRFTPEELQRLQQLCPAKTPTYCLFNNAASSADAQQFARLVTPRNQSR